MFNKDQADLVRATVNKWGTPIHIFNKDRLLSNAELLTSKARVLNGFKTYYSVKTNYLPDIVRSLAQAGWGADVVSGYEMELALNCGFRPEDIVFNGPMKTEAELIRAVKLGVFVNLDSLVEAQRLNNIASAQGIKLDVGLRLNPNINVYPSTDVSFNLDMEHKARLSKFGWPTECLDDAVSAFAGFENLNLVGVHCQLGSQITSLGALSAAIEKVVLSVCELRKKFAIRYLNLGGGIAVGGIVRTRSGPLYSLLANMANTQIKVEPEMYSLDEYFSSVKGLIDRYDLSDISVSCEPGRVIVSDAMCLITSVVNRKDNALGSWLVVDGGLNLMPTAGPAEVHGIEAMMGRDKGADKKFVLGGPMCYEQDIFSYNCCLPENVQVGDYLIIKDTGAYTVSRSTNFIRERAPVAEVSNGQSRLCWRREEYSDIFSFEVDESL